MTDTSRQEIVAQPLALSELPDGAGHGGAVIGGGIHPLHQVKATLQACVGQARLTVGELLSAQEQQVIRLDRAVGDAVDLLVEGQVVARGELVAVDGCFAVRITELPLPLVP